ncbi:hypothetical protein D3C81_1240370 [compost metagenome]
MGDPFFVLPFFLVADVFDLVLLLLFLVEAMICFHLFIHRIPKEIIMCFLFSNYAIVDWDKKVDINIS